MRFLYVLLLLCVWGLRASAEDPFPAAAALLPQHEHPTTAGPSLALDEIEQMAFDRQPRNPRRGAAVGRDRSACALRRGTR